MNIQHPGDGHPSRLSSTLRLGPRAVFDTLMLRNIRMKRNPEIPPRDRCLFFQLPAEVRNLICEYALSFETALYCKLTYQPLPKFWRCQVDPNSIKTKWPNSLEHVCQQTRQETKGLLFHYNCVVFLGPTDCMYSVVDMQPCDPYTVTGRDLFMNFVHQNHQPSSAGFKKVVVLYKGVTIEQRVFDFLADGTMLPTFCRQNPDTKVVVCFRLWAANMLSPYSEHGGVIDRLSTLLGRKTPVCPCPEYHLRYILELHERLKQRAKEVPLPPNLSVNIMHTYHFSKETLKRRKHDCFVSMRARPLLYDNPDETGQLLLILSPSVLTHRI
jgi:hypothetical protein